MQIHLYLLFKQSLVVSLQGTSHISQIFFFLSLPWALEKSCCVHSAQLQAEVLIEPLVNLQSTLSLALGWAGGKARDQSTSLLFFLVFFFSPSPSSVLSSQVIIPHPQIHSCWTVWACMEYDQSNIVTQHITLQLFVSFSLLGSLFSLLHTFAFAPLSLSSYSKCLWEIFLFTAMFIQGQYGKEMDSS